GSGNAGTDRMAAKPRQRGRIGGEGSKDGLAEGVDGQLFEAVLLEPEARRHAPLAGNAAPEGDAVEIACEIVAPSVIDAGQIVGVAAPLQANEIAAMGAAVDHCVDLAVLPPGDDDRRLAEKGRQVIAWLRQFTGKCQILPG